MHINGTFFMFSAQIGAGVQGNFGENPWLTKLTPGIF